MHTQILLLIGVAGLMFLIIGGLAFISHYYTLNGIKSKTVGDGQHGTARWATKQEIRQTYAHIPFEPELWRQGKNLPDQQGLILGCEGPKGHVTAVVDTDDIHALVTAASGAGKTAFFLYPNAVYQSDLSHRARAVYMYLKDRSDAEGQCWPAIKTIGAELGLSRSTVKRALDDLCKAGLLQKDPRWRENGSYTSNLYRLL